MLDPIGGFNRLREFFISYLETAYRIRDPDLTGARRRLLSQIGTLTASPFLEPVPRYEAVTYGLEELAKREGDNPIAPLDEKSRIAFVELALSGLFPGKDDANGPVLRKGDFPPYSHQMQMLERGLRDGQPAIVTSGTGSGKTESFMLPVLASIVKEAASWPKVPGDYLNDRWWTSDTADFRLKRWNEPAARRKAVRALILYPMNALVEDQMTRLRRTLDSNDARAVLDRRLGGNRIFFGRYTSAAPVTGHLVHPRLFADPDEAKRLQRRKDELRRRMRDMVRDQDGARQYDASNAQEDPTRYLFPAVDGAEMLTRWDMQETPPDILVTNASMLSTMLAREVETPIFEKTRAWLAEEPEARFYLVLDELHLIRGSSGTEVAGLLRVLFHKLGLDEPAIRHKLRILASSASMPVAGAGGEQSMKYLDNFFGPFGTFKAPGDAGFASRDAWKACIVPGEPKVPSRSGSGVLDPSPFRQLVAVMGDTRLISKWDPSSEEFKSAVRACHQAMRGNNGPVEIDALVKASVEEAAAVLTFGCTSAGSNPPIRATSIEDMANKIFGGSEPAMIDGLRGLTILRGMGDTLKEKLGTAIDDKTTSFRLHQFVRSIEGMFATPRIEDGALRFDGLTVERGVTYTSDGRGVRRKFELLYCEACGEVFMGGQRGTSGGGGAAIELLPSSPDLGRLPESGGMGHYEDLSFDDFAIFWPSTAAPRDTSMGENWLPASLDARVGVVRPAGGGEETVAGRVFMSTNKRTHGRTSASPNTAAPDCCPACGISYAQRKNPRYSPIRSFRTGFTKTSQLMATELFELLHAAGSMKKAVVFSDSRQDAANAALRIEQSHYQDLRRQLVVEIAKTLSSAKDNAEEIARLRSVMQDATNRGDFEEVARLSTRIVQLRRSSGNRRVRLSLIVEQLAADSGAATNPMLRRMLELGIHPSDDAGVAEFGEMSWPELFVRSAQTGQMEWETRGTKRNEIATTRNRIIEDQGPHVDEVLFSKTYFALEETGLGYPSLFFPEETPNDRLDAYLRVFADAYRVSTNRYSLDRDPQEWPSGGAVTSQRLKDFARASNPAAPNGELARPIHDEHGVLGFRRDPAARRGSPFGVFAA